MLYIIVMYLASSFLYVLRDMCELLRTHLFTPKIKLISDCFGGRWWPFTILSLDHKLD
jgi:hypothetical protein